MKRFDFNLDPILRWRKAVAELRNAEVLTCMKAVADAERDLEALRREQADAGRQIATRPDGAGLAAWAAYLERSRRQIETAQDRVSKTQIALKSAMQRLLEADRNTQLLEKLRTTQQNEWKAEADREIEAFAAESFLNRRE